MEKGRDCVRIGGRACALLGDPEAAAVLIQPVDARDLAGLDAEAACLRRLTDRPFLLAAFAVERWNDELSPWPAPAVFRGEGFSGGAQAALDYVLDALMPAVAARCPAVRRRQWMLGGYSLAGLFALWAASRTDRFSGVAAVSPSVWYPGWLEYARARAPLAGRVYLSLGDREERARNPVMARVGDAIRAQRELLEGRAECTLEWNPGNHFAEPEARVARGFAWLMR